MSADLQMSIDKTSRMLSSHCVWHSTLPFAKAERKKKKSAKKDSTPNISTISQIILTHTAFSNHKDNNSVSSMLLLTFLLTTYPSVESTITRCQTNCDSKSARLVGPTKPKNTRPHPWLKAPFPFPFDGFCKLGCQLFFSEDPYNVTCKSSCDFAQRYGITIEYSDLGEIAKLECRDGCDIGLYICQAGYYCVDGYMRTCPPGRFRGDSTEHVTSCTDCPYGRYRVRDKGTTADTCTKCPKGKYVNTTGSITPDACLRCPAGMSAEEEGMALCKCITPESCDMGLTQDGLTHKYFENGVDYYRETIPFVGRF
jgi:hypothetical protein